MNQPKTDQQIMETLAELGGGQTRSDDITYSGDRLIIPERMTARDALAFLRLYVAQQEESIVVSRTFPYRPLDGARAARNVLRNLFGLFAQGGDGAAQLTLTTGLDQTEQVPWG